ncbi:hypothetical protein [Spongiivirga citrea]|uniref:Uncharacterized protein n=1 Tax=Spongiivirga citrea TaxID=1481457 RepID=A0A6M0CG43_9FLAO|nr:hypothetical protein [Spongiivirga citrea]NER15853.1 hypothetical protein [Spongiivirga citrea]
MKLTTLSLSLTVVFLLTFSVKNAHGEDLKLLKSFTTNGVKPNTNKTTIIINILKMNNNPCDTGGSVKVAEGNKAFTSYKNVLKQLDVAERNASRGINPETSIKMAKRNMLSVLKKEPNADLSEVCQRLQKLESELTSIMNGAESRKASQRQKMLKREPVSIDNDKVFFEEQLRKVTRVYFDSSKGVYPDELGLEYPDWFLKEVDGFNREEVLSRAQGSSYEDAKEIMTVLEDYSAFLDRQGVGEYLMDLLDQQNNGSSDQLSKKAKEINTVAKALKNLAGSNASMDRVIAFTEKQLGKADAALSNIYSSPIHKKYINQVIFTKQPFKPGGEGSLEINPTFKAGDAVYATVYLSASIKDAVDSWKGYGKGGTMGLKVKNSNGDFLNRKFEAWEVSSFSNYEVSISDNTSKEQTIVQFVLIPNKESSIKTEMTSKNITPILMARGLSLESERLKEYKVEVASSGKVTGPVTYKGSFKIDLASGKGPNYYNEVENQKMETLLESVALPTAKINNASLETQLLAEMKKQGFQEQFKKAYIQTNWQLFEPPFKEAYKEMTASFTYTTSDGKCGWQNYSFRSFKTGDGWSGPQKWGGANQRQRVSCKKIK